MRKRSNTTRSKDQPLTNKQARRDSNVSFSEGATPIHAGLGEQFSLATLHESAYVADGSSSSPSTNREEYAFTGSNSASSASVQTEGQNPEIPGSAGEGLKSNTRKRRACDSSSSSASSCRRNDKRKKSSPSPTDGATPDVEAMINDLCLFLTLEREKELSGEKSSWTINDVVDRFIQTHSRPKKDRPLVIAYILYGLSKLCRLLTRAEILQFCMENDPLAWVANYCRHQTYNGQPDRTITEEEVECLLDDFRILSSIRGRAKGLTRTQLREAWQLFPVKRSSAKISWGKNMNQATAVRGIIMEFFLDKRSHSRVRAKKGVTPTAKFYDIYHSVVNTGTRGQVVLGRSEYSTIESKEEDEAQQQQSSSQSSSSFSREIPHEEEQPGASDPSFLDSLLDVFMMDSLLWLESEEMEESAQEGQDQIPMVLAPVSGNEEHLDEDQSNLLSEFAEFAYLDEY